MEYYVKQVYANYLYPDRGIQLLISFVYSIKGIRNKVIINL